MTTSGSSPWWSKDTVAVVTGANTGIGYAIARLLADHGLTVVLTARNPERGQAALDELKAAGGPKSVWFHQLDVQNTESIQTLAAWLKSKFGGFDILVNNAGIAYPSRSSDINYENAKEVIETNYYGVKNVTEGLLPLLRSSPDAPRIVNVTSELGQYKSLRSEELKQILSDESSYTQELVDSLARQYLEDVKADRWNDKWVAVGGGVVNIYSVSKILLNAYSIVLANSLSIPKSEDDRQILLASFTPGATHTDTVTRAIKEGYPFPPGFRPKTAAEGADSAVWLALLPKDQLAEKHGKFFKDRKEYAFGWQSHDIV